MRNKDKKKIKSKRGKPVFIPKDGMQLVDLPPAILRKIGELVYKYILLADDVAAAGNWDYYLQVLDDDYCHPDIIMDEDGPQVAILPPHSSRWLTFYSVARGNYVNWFSSGSRDGELNPTDYWFEIRAGLDRSACIGLKNPGVEVGPMVVNTRPGATEPTHWVGIYVYKV